MDLGLNGKKVVVTGASKGIGRAVAEAFAAEGARLVLASRDAKALRGVAQAIGGDAEIVVADLASDAGRAALFDAHGDADILVNNAGAIPRGGINDVTMAAWRAGWELKVFGYIDLCQRFYPGMAARGQGVIVNIIGMGGRMCRPDYICGAAGNAALIAFTNALGAESQSHGVRVFGINPTRTMTDRTAALFRSRAKSELGDENRWQELIDTTSLPFRRLTDTGEVASMSAMLASARAGYLSGTVVDLDGGLQWSGLS